MRIFTNPRDGLVCLLFLLLLSGCAVVGPQSISAGRASYAEAINKTEDEQMLLSIVKGRYGETSSMLAVSGVAANMRFRAEAGIEAAFGPDSLAGENLMLGGFAYEENPTITYAPVQGEQYLRELMSPIPMEILMLSLRSATFSDRILTLLVARVNDLHNPDFERIPLSDQKLGFERFVELFSGLHNVGVLDLSKNPQNDIAFNLLIENYRSRYANEVNELLTLLNLPLPQNDIGELIIPVSFAIKTDQGWGLGLITRSTFDLIEVFRASVEIPEEHANAGLTVDYPPKGLPGQGIEIISSKVKPNDMSLAVPYRGYWFYIRTNDQRTKSFFSVLRTLWSISIAGAIEHADEPVLTLPVGR
jgi:hypothetical protein